ncbi:MAG: hypothetical protein OXN90_03400 [Gemmatimonadota bacterium]|nr:hypothetical protein [Gemmatimonadota bacterium]
MAYNPDMTGQGRNPRDRPDGRTTQYPSPDQIDELYGVRATPLPPDRPPRYNGAPGQDFSACRLDPDGAREIVRLRWGLVPS